MILITGAGSQLGRNLIELWTRKKLPLRPADLLDRPCFAEHQAVIGDLSDPVLLREAVKDVQTIVHLAEARPDAATVERFGVRGYDKWLFQQNLENTRLLAEAARDAGVHRIIYLSSTSVYGPPPSVSPCNELTQPDPRGPYGRSKLEAEQLLLAMHQRGEIEPIILRCCPMLGNYEPEGEVEKQLLEKAVKNSPIVLFGNHQVLKHRVHVRDVVDCIDRCLERPQSVGRLYNIAGRSAATRIRVTHEVLKALDSRSMLISLPKSSFTAANAFAGLLGNPLVIPEFAEVPFAHSCYSIERAVAELGWRPKYDTVQAYVETALWYGQSHGKVK